MNTEDEEQMAFALITLEDDENPSSTDTSMLKEKLSRFAEAGLTQGQVKREVTNFIMGLSKPLDFFSPKVTKS